MMFRAVLSILGIALAGSAEAQERLGGATVDGREIVIMDDFTWTYEQTEPGCFLGAAPGIDLCGLNDFEWVLANTRNGLLEPQVFLIRPEGWPSNAFMSIVTTRRGRVSELASAYLDVTDGPEFEGLFVDVVEERETLAVGEPARTYLFRIEGAGSPLMMAATIWDRQADGEIDMRHRFQVAVGEPFPDDLLDWHIRMLQNVRTSGDD